MYGNRRRKFIDMGIVLTLRGILHSGFQILALLPLYPKEFGTRVSEKIKHVANKSHESFFTTTKRYFGERAKETWILIFATLGGNVV